MSVWQDILRKLGLGGLAKPRTTLRVFVLDDDTLRHDWFARRFAGDRLDFAEEPARAVELLSSNPYDAIFLDHDLLPEHYHAEEHDDERTGYAVAAWLAAHPAAHPFSTVIVHTRNADGALRMVNLMRHAGRRAEHVPFPLLAAKVKSYWKR